MNSKTATLLLESVRKTYNSIALEFDRTRQKLWPDFEHFVDYIPENPRILDVGCGNGRLLQFFEDKPFYSYLGIDNSSALLKRACKQYKGSKIHFKEGDALHLSMKAGSYDAVFSIAVLHHIPSRELRLKAVLELSRMLSSDGTLFFSVWDLKRFRSFPYFIRSFFRWVFSFGDYSVKDLMIPWGRKNPKMRYCYAFSGAELRQLFRDAGLEVVASWRTSKGKFGNHMIVARPFLGSRVAQVMGVNFHGITLDESVQIVERFLKSNDQHFVVTPNPEIVLKARKDKAYRRLLNKASLSIPDGIGILWASSFVVGVKFRLLRVMRGIFGLFMLFISSKSLHRVLPERVTGVDLIGRLSHQSHHLGAKIFLLGAAPGVADQVAEKWRFDQIVGAFSGSPKLRDESEIIQRVNESGANMLFVAYGAPQQEEWIDRNLKKMPGVKVAIGVGGSFDFVAGVRYRAPNWMCRFGLEWFWRLLQEPRRIVRILNATVRFPLTVMLSKD